MKIPHPVIPVVLSIMIIAAPAFSGEKIEITIPGAEFSPFSQGCIKTGGGDGSCLLNALDEGGYAIYDFEVRPDADRISARADIVNPAGRDIDVFIYNYGSRRESNQLLKPGLKSRWLRWETASVDGRWVAHSPEYLVASSSGGDIDLLGEHNVVRLLFYADSGTPPDNEMFIVKSVTLSYETSVDLSSEAESSEGKVWKEGNRFYAYGIGHPPTDARTEGQARAMAVRAATADAYRNLLGYLKGIPLPPGKGDSRIVISGDLEGAATEKTEYFDDGSVRVTLMVSDKRVLTKVKPK
jgi:hypothetical protein